MCSYSLSYNVAVGSITMTRKRSIWWQGNKKLTRFIWHKNGTPECYTFLKINYKIFKILNSRTNLEAWSIKIWSCEQSETCNAALNFSYLSTIAPHSSRVSWARVTVCAVYHMASPRPLAISMSPPTPIMDFSPSYHLAESTGEYIPQPPDSATASSLWLPNILLSLHKKTSNNTKQYQTKLQVLIFRHQMSFPN